VLIDGRGKDSRAFVGGEDGSAVSGEEIVKGKKKDKNNIRWEKMGACMWRVIYRACTPYTYRIHEPSTRTCATDTAPRQTERAKGKRHKKREHVDELNETLSLQQGREKSEFLPLPNSNKPPPGWAHRPDTTDVAKLRR
jgi:hypothetical protein